MTKPDAKSAGAGANTTDPAKSSPPSILRVEAVTRFQPGDLHDICDASEDAIRAGGGFGWLEPPYRSVLENYWKGVLVIPERILIVARIDGVICGSAQLVRPPPNNEAQAFAVQLQHNFIAPWARGHGLAKMMVDEAETLARNEGFDVITLDVRATQERAIALYESLDYYRWGRNPFYARVGDKLVAGLYFYKDLRTQRDAIAAWPRDREFIG